MSADACVSSKGRLLRLAKDRVCFRMSFLSASKLISFSCQRLIYKLVFFDIPGDYYSLLKRMQTRNCLNINQYEIMTLGILW